MSEPNVNLYEASGRFLFVKGALGPQQRCRLHEIDRALPAGCPMVDEVVGGLRARGISLRQVDWLVSKYGISNGIVHWGKTAPVALCHAYYSMLKVWRRRGFDPFCRWDRVFYQGRDGALKTTSVGQLNFWLIMTRDFDIVSHMTGATMQKVREDMAAWERRDRKKKIKRARRKAPPVRPTAVLRSCFSHRQTTVPGPPTRFP